MIEINGVAHVILSVSDWDECRTFYQALLSFMGLEQVFAGEDFVYYVGGRTMVTFWVLRNACARSTSSLLRQRKHT